MSTLQYTQPSKIHAIYRDKHEVVPLSDLKNILTFHI